MEWVQGIINIEVLERVSCKDKRRWAEMGMFETDIKKLQLLIMMRSTAQL